MSYQGLLAKVALPYAEALLESAKDLNLIEKTNQDLSLISDILLKSTDLKLFLENPLITTKAKKNVLNQLLLNQINSSVLKFLFVLVDRRRIPLLNVIIEKYLDLVYELDSVIIAKVLTAKTFTEEQQYNLIDKIKKITSSKQVKLDIQIDTSLIGGFTVKIGSKIIDTSLSGKLKQIAFYLSTS
uniref:ATP synthase subunit delta n=1 Tax=Mastocarpus papillatus TaxID=31436 RepID=A0A342RZM4_9FLOR|nr:ATP synthase subunit delta [Mastocarpus papillatus]AOL58170.1 ATP synthase subunit delta [Mastocarpus papillatus]